MGLIGGALLLAGCGAAKDPVTARSDADVAGTSMTVFLPVGAVEITVGQPLDRIAPSEAEDGEEHDSPGGWDYVPVRTALLDVNADTGVIRTTRTTPEASTIEVVVGGERHALPSPYTVDGTGTIERTPSTVYLPVPADEADELEVVVGHDGVEQRIGPDGRREAGAAEAFYDGTAFAGPALDCSEPWGVPAGVRVSIGCSATPTVAPYLPGVGWAEDGHVFVQVDLEVFVSDATRNGRTPSWRDLVLTPSIEGADLLDPAADIGLQPPKVSHDLYVRSFFFSVPVQDQYRLRLDLDIWGIPATSSTALVTAGKPTP